MSQMSCFVTSSTGDLATRLGCLSGVWVLSLWISFLQNTSMENSPESDGIFTHDRGREGERAPLRDTATLRLNRTQETRRDL